MLRLRELGYGYPGSDHAAVRNINLDIGENEFVAILGRNGSGKSTLGRLLSGITLPVSGRVEVDGLFTDRRDDLRLIHKKVGLLSANPDNQLIGASVEEDVAFGPGNLNLHPSEIKKRVDAALAMVSMEDYKKYPPNLLSGGQKQKVCLAGLLAMQPQYMVLDEPTAMLDAAARQDLLSTLSSLQRELHISIIFISNRLEDVLPAKRLLIMDQGQVVMDGPSREILLQVEPLLKAGIEPLEIRRIIQYLYANGLELNADILKPSDLVDELCRLRSMK